VPEGERIAPERTISHVCMATMNAYPNIFSLPAPEGENPSGGELSPVRKQAASKPDLDRFLEDFISGREPQTTQWIRLASMVASQSFSCDVVIRVLRPKEKVASGNLPIDKLGVSIARKVGAKYSPGRLRRAEVRMEDAVPGRAGEAGEQFTFDKSFLPAAARVLVIGDQEASPSMFEAIRLAVTQQLPKAEVKLFTLYWLEQHFRSELIDNRYFLSSASPLSVLSRQANPHNTAERGPGIAKGEAAPADLPAAEIPPPAEKGVEIPPAPVVDEVSPPPAESGPVLMVEAAPAPVEEIAPVPAGDAAPAKTLAKDHAPSRAERKRVGPQVQVSKKAARIPPWSVVLVLGILVLGGSVVVVGNKTGMFASKAEPSDASVVPEPTELLAVEPRAVAAEAPATQAPPQVRPKGPQGVIAVPSAGLRAGPSLDAKSLRKSVRNNERVTILRRKPSSAGPDWLQIETKSGTVGWVWASVVREVRRK